MYLIDHPNRAYKQFRETRRRGNHGGRLTGAIILHDAENATDLVGEDLGAESVARYISTRDTPGSYHTITDRDSTIRMAPFEYEVWHDTTSNNYAIGVAVAWRKADLPRMTYAQREAYYRRFARAVLEAREFLRAERGIVVPLDRYRTRAEIVAGQPGISTHSRMDPSRRSDPFGTGSAYEREFWAVLLDEVGGKGSTPASTPTPEEDIMTPTQEAKLDRVLELLDQIDGALATGVKSRSIGQAVAELPHKTAQATLGALIGRGSKRRSIAQAIAGTESDVDTALTILQKES